MSIENRIDGQETSGEGIVKKFDKSIRNKESAGELKKTMNARFNTWHDLWDFLGIKNSPGKKRYNLRLVHTGDKEKNIKSVLRNSDLSKKESASAYYRDIFTDPQKALEENISTVQSDLDYMEQTRLKIIGELADLNKKKNLTEKEKIIKENLEIYINSYDETILQQKKYLEDIKSNPNLSAKTIPTIYGDAFAITNEDIKNNTEAYEYYDQQIEENIQQMKSDTYLHRLMKEFKADAKEAEKIRQMRINNMTQGGYELGDWNDASFSPKLYEASYDGKTVFRDEPNTMVTKLPLDGTIADTKKDNPYVATHEIQGHKSTNGEAGLSLQSEKILQDSYVPSLQGDGLMSAEERNDYLMNASERYARKKVLDYEMEKLGIKKYKEFFRKEHYDKLMEYYGQGKLSKNAKQFIETTKKDYKVYQKIFNGIADIGNAQVRSNVA